VTRLTVKLTDKSIAALKPKAERYEVWDDAGRGFGVRVTPRGTKSFILVYHYGGRPRRLTLGNYPKMGLADANIELGKARKALELGNDPGTTAVAAHEAERKAETVDQLVADYLKRHAKPNKRSAAEDERMLNKDVLPHWRGRKAKDIRRRDVVDLLDRVVDRDAKVAANRLLAVVRRMFNFAIERGILEASPVIKIKPPGGKEKARERHLSDAEVRQFWSGLDRARMERGLRYVLRLLLVTGQRKSEVVGLRKREFNLTDKTWFIPAERSKSGRPHLVPLSQVAIDVLTKAEADAQKILEKRESAEDWLFPSSRTGVPFTGQAVDHAVRDLFKERHRKRGSKAEHKRPVLKGVLDPFTPHDLRRSASTAMRRLGVSREDVKLVLNHVDRSVTARVYDRYEGLDEKRRALTRWGRHLAAVVSGETTDGKVVKFGHT
jgi:integrase